MRDYIIIFRVLYSITYILLFIFYISSSITIYITPEKIAILIILKELVIIKVVLY
jgi:hypothetical protein